ncbi:hypothetical protein ACQ4PT_035761 [Festuca glaucescens]
MVKPRTLTNSGRRIRKKPGSKRQKPEGYNSEFNRAVRRILKFHACQKAAADAVKKECDDEEEHYGRPQDPVVHTSFEESQFGDLRSSQDLPCSVVSIALFDGDTMLFACSGIPLPGGRSKLELTRYVTSARLVSEYEGKRYRDDKLRFQVRLPNGREKGGFLELFNHNIAIVTVLDRQAGHPLDVEHLAGPQVRLVEDDEMLAAGRAFKSGCLRAAEVKAVPYGEKVWFRPFTFDPRRYSELLSSLWKPVKSYEGGPVALLGVLGGPVLGKDNKIIGMSINVDIHGAYVSILPMEQLCMYLKHFQILNPAEINFRRYSLPELAYTMYPSGFMSKIYRLRHLGYPMPPPLMLELNGKLLNQFETLFGDIEVFLPPKQRASGKLEFYSLQYNIAIVSFEKKFISICPENISRKYSTLKPSEKVVAVGREPLDGLLMASTGGVKPRDKDCQLDCKDLKVSTCKIKKAGIGGPLINLDGSFVGMNFFDGRKLTPYLPRSKIVQVLRSKINLPLPSERGVDTPVHLKGAPRGNRILLDYSYRWPVPEPYWYHGLLEVDRGEHKHIGRVLQ